VRILGPAAAQPGAKLPDLLAPHAAKVTALIESSWTSGEARDVDLEIAPPGSRGRIWVELSVNPLGSNLLQGLVIDITERKRAESAAHELAARDAVTGLLNRRGIDETLARLLGLRAEARVELALLQIDLDYFKAVNDNYGHEAGDRVLRAVAQVLEHAVRRSDIVGRIGGDEFVVLLPGVENAAKAQEIASSIIAGVSRPIDIGDGRYAQIGASVGIALAGDARETPATLLRRADGAMYRAKQAGRGRVCAAEAAA
jgi:diguanylate cyclase (GGDEF)-like protein